MSIAEKSLVSNIKRGMTLNNNGGASQSQIAIIGGGNYSSNMSIDMTKNQNQTS